MRAYTLSGLTLGLFFLAGCPGDESDPDRGAYDDDVEDDDGGDDDGDDDLDDDDIGDDDCHDSPWGFYVDVGLEVSGGADGGPATVRYGHVMIDRNVNVLCTISMEIAADYTYGPDQGPAFIDHADEIVVWSSGVEVDRDCPADWDISLGDFAQWYLWDMHPMAFTSCDLVDDDGELASQFLGLDAAGNIPTPDGTFGDYCQYVGPALQSVLGTGPIEAIWLKAGMSGGLDEHGDFTYFEPMIPTDPSKYDSWWLMGVLMADAANAEEPTEGLEGGYVAIPFWLWEYALPMGIHPYPI